MEQNLPPTKLEYYEFMSKLHSTATLLSYFEGEDGRGVMILDSTIFHPQGGGQPADTGFIISNSNIKFVVQDVRSKDQIVFHYGFFDNLGDVASSLELEKGSKVSLSVDEPRRNLNTRLHSAGHLLDMCIANVGWGHLKPLKGYHFPDGPFVEYGGTVPQNELQIKQKELEEEANNLISKRERVFVSTFPYEEARQLCGGDIPDYIPKGSNPRIVKFGENPACPCGGTHVSDVSEIKSLKVSQIRTKKGKTKVFYNIPV